MGYPKPNLRIDSGPPCRGKVKTRRIPDRAGAGATRRLRRGRSGALAGRVEGRREDDEGGAIDHHPVSGEAPPDDRGSLASLFSGGCLGHENREIYKRVDEKEIEQVAKPVGRSLGHYLPKILPVGTANTLLGHKNSRKKYDKDADV